MPDYDEDTKAKITGKVKLLSQICAIFAVDKGELIDYTTQLSVQRPPRLRCVRKCFDISF